MDKSIHCMDYPLMPSASDALLLKSYHHVPDSRWSRGFSFLSRAGHFTAGPGYRNERTSIPGHEIFLCLRGRGFVRQSGKTDTIDSGSLVWIDVNHPHAHWADPVDPWEVYWIRAEGIQLDAAHEILDSRGSFSTNATPAALLIFERIFQLFEDHRHPFDALANAEIAQLLALFAGNLPSGDGDESPIPEIAGVLADMRIYYQRRWTISAIARRCKKSPAQVHRIFHRAVGSSPIAWIRRIRIEQAMQKLLSTADSVAEIAYQVGYNDPLFFSRDFKKAVGSSPTDYRRHERK